MRWTRFSCVCKNVLPAYSIAKIIKIKRVFPDLGLWSQMYCHVFTKHSVSHVRNSMMMVIVAISINTRWFDVRKMTSAAKRRFSSVEPITLSIGVPYKLQIRYQWTVTRLRRLLHARRESQNLRLVRYIHRWYWNIAVYDSRYYICGGTGWRGGATGIALDLRLIGRGFKCYSKQRRLTALGRLFTPMCLCH